MALSKQQELVKRQLLRDHPEAVLVMQDGEFVDMAEAKHTGESVTISGDELRLYRAAPKSHDCNKIALAWLEHPAVHDAFRGDRLMYTKLGYAITGIREAIASATAGQHPAGSAAAGEAK